MTIIDPTTYPLAPGEEPVLVRLGKAGYDIGSLAELCVSGVRYRKAIPILVAALSEVTEKRALDWVVRALSVPWAKPQATGPLLELFRQSNEPRGDSALYSTTRLGQQGDVAHRVRVSGVHTNVGGWFPCL